MSSGAESRRGFDIVVLGLSLSSSWGNGHATTYRSLLREMHRRGHRVTFLERDVPWYASNRDLASAPYCRLALYSSVDELRERFNEQIRSADVVIVGSFVPDGVEVAKWVLKTATGATAFYDIDTPVTLAKIGRGDYEYISPELIPEFDLYLSFTGGGTLDRLETEFGAQAARALFCSVDPDEYYPDGDNQRDGESGRSGGGGEFQYDLGYLGTYSEDRQPRLERRLVDAARAWPNGRFIVVGPGYPAEIRWPANVAFSPHMPPSEHRQFYNAQRFTLNITRVDMVRVGYAPSVRLFEAAACGTPIISDYWEGIETLFEPDREILISHCGEDTLRYLRHMSDVERRAVGRRACARVLSAHTAAHRARELEDHLAEVMKYSDSFESK
jgi:spore maturation protein CgeB